MNSIWHDGIEKPRFDMLEGDARTDVLIIGGGLAGILSAYVLKSFGADCMLLEANEICSGITKNTTAKITLSHGLIYDKLIRRYGMEKAAQYLMAQSEAMAEYARLAEKIPCDYEKKTSYVYSLDDLEKIEKEINALNKLGVAAELSPAGELPIKVAGAVEIKGQAQFHPLKFVYGIAKELPIYENTKVKELLPGKAITERGTVSFKSAIIATHFPILNKHGAYFVKMYQHRSYVLALEGAPIPDGMYLDESGRGLSFRGYGDLLLLGGGAQRTGKSGGGWHVLENFKAEHYPEAKIVTKWATQDCMTLDGVPYIGRYSRGTSDLYVATGFNKWGMTSSMASAKILADLIKGKSNPYADVFAPSRSILHPQLAVNLFETTVGLLTLTAPRCPHLGCALKYNAAEHSWDCPCHGSRFTENGGLIDNPATGDKK